MKIEERENFKGILRADGTCVDYYWLEERDKSDTDGTELEEWKGRFIGYPLVKYQTRIF